MLYWIFTVCMVWLGIILIATGAGNGAPAGIVAGAASLAVGVWLLKRRLSWRTLGLGTAAVVVIATPIWLWATLHHHVDAGVDLAGEPSFKTGAYTAWVTNHERRAEPFNCTITVTSSGGVVAAQDRFRTPPIADGGSYERKGTLKLSPSAAHVGIFEIDSTKITCLPG
jgi:hypothetical protein